MTELRITVGIPASGKSTAAQGWLDRGEVSLVVSSDGMREELTGSATNFMLEDAVWSVMTARVAQTLGAGYSAGVDATNLVPGYRKAWIDLGDAFDVPVVAYRFPIRLDKAMARNAARDRVVPADVMQEMYEKWWAYGATDELESEGFVVVNP